MAADTGPAWVRLNADAEPGPRGTMAERRTASRHKEDARMPVRRTILFGAFSHSQMAALPHRRDRGTRPPDGGPGAGPKAAARMPVRRTILFGAFSHSQMAALPHRRDREPRPLDGGTVPGPSRSPLPL